MNRETGNEDRHRTQMQHNFSYREYWQQYDVHTCECPKKKRRSVVKRGKEPYRLYTQTDGTDHNIGGGGGGQIYRRY